MYRKFLKNFAAVSVILLILAAGLVVLFDPFFIIMNRWGL